MDAQASFPRQPVRQDHIDMLQSLHSRRELDLPRKLPAKARFELEGTAALRQQLADLLAVACEDPNHLHRG